LFRVPTEKLQLHENKFSAQSRTHRKSHVGFIWVRGFIFRRGILRRDVLYLIL